VLAGELKQENNAPNGVVLAYPVITSGAGTHLGSFKNLLGEEYALRKKDYSLERRIVPGTAPAFLWHTAGDTVVPVKNSMLYAENMWKAGNRCELRVFQIGNHGLALGYGRKDVAEWPRLAKEFLIHNAGFRFPETPVSRTVVLTFDDATKNQLTFVAPLLKKYGFGATFFPCNFDAEWRRKHLDTLMDKRDLKSLQDMGFEIGNHTDNHKVMTELDAVGCKNEILSFKQYLDSAGVKNVTSFAYPCGNYDDKVVSVVKESGFTLARTIDRAAWNVKACDPLKIPAIPIAGNSQSEFYKAVDMAKTDKPVVLVLHGVPDTVHPHCTVSEEFFKMMLEYLSSLNCQVLGLREAYEKLK
jgi:peptidoglycan/xylan/chitin deacetylase (PgdA/CDA1 family)